MAPSAKDLSARLEELEEELQFLAQAASQDENGREKLLKTLRRSVAQVETPWEVVSRMYMEPCQAAAMRASQEMGLVEAVVAGTKTSAELASITKCDERLIVRILRALCSVGIFSEEGFQTYGSTAITKALMEPAVGGSFKFMYDQGGACLAHLSEYLVKTGFKEPAGGCFRSAFNTDLDLFPWLMAHPPQMSNFNDCMAGQRLNRVDFFDVAPMEDILLKGYKDDGPILVDIGGNRGYDLVGLKKKYPAFNGPGKLILQDLPQVIAAAGDIDEEITKMAYDFHTPQPVKGARAYYMRYIMHDYSDSICQKILKNIVDAMTPGSSKLLIFDFVLPDVGAPSYPSLLDINMMALLSGMERTETQWKVLLESVGLELVQFHKDGKNTEGLVEAILKSDASKAS